MSYGTKGNNDVVELAAWAATEFGFGKVAGALGWSREDRGGIIGDEDTRGGSVSWLAPIGVNVTLGCSTSEIDDPAVPKKKFGYAKVGYLMGHHAVSLVTALTELRLNSDGSLTTRHRPAPKLRTSISPYHPHLT